MEDKLETEYIETRRMKNALDDLRIEYDVNCKECRDKDLKQTVTKTKVANKKLENDQKQLQGDSLMLQNVVSSKSKEVSELETLVKSLGSSKACDKCDNIQGIKNCFNEHVDKTHKDETVPSTFKRGLCDFESSDEKNINAHVKTKHDISCEICDLTFQCQDRLRKHCVESL